MSFQGIVRAGVLLRTSRPLSLCNIGTPFLPVLGVIAVLFQPSLLLGEELMAIEDDHFEKIWRLAELVEERQ